MSQVGIDLLSVLQGTALLSSLTLPEIEILAARTVRKRFGLGEMLFYEGGACHGLFILARGRVRIFKTSAAGREQVLAVNGPGESVAELPVFDGGAYPASAVAIEDAEVAFISRRDFQAFCMEHPAVSLKLLAVVGARLRRLVAIIEELSFTTVRQRLVALLLKLGSSQGKSIAGGIALQLPASHQELANELGTVREIISRNLTRLQAEGLIEVDARLIVLKDVGGLRALLDAAA